MSTWREPNLNMRHWARLEGAVVCVGTTSSTQEYMCQLTIEE